MLKVDQNLSNLDRLHEARESIARLMVENGRLRESAAAARSVALAEAAGEAEAHGAYEAAAAIRALDK
jgi:hypothetical protein